MSDDKEYIFTFGFGQGFNDGFFAINSDNSNKAKNKMFEVFGSNWSMQYDAPNAREKAGVDRFNLWEVK